MILFLLVAILTYLSFATQEADVEFARDSIRDMQKQFLALKEEGKIDEANLLQTTIKVKMEEYQKLTKSSTKTEERLPAVPSRPNPKDIAPKPRYNPVHADPEDMMDFPDELSYLPEDIKSRMGMEPDELRSRIQERMKERRDNSRESRRSPRNHEERTKFEKEDNMKHREFLRKRADDMHGRISQAGFDEKEIMLLKKHIEELHSHELKLADSRLQITLDFEGVREMTDKVKRRKYLDEKRRKREIQREKDNVIRERIKEIRDHLDNRLREKERGSEL